jgi:hypothetical protein
MSAFTELVQRIPNFHKWNHPEKVRFFGWCIHALENKDRFAAVDIRRCYVALSEPQPANINPYLAALVNRKPKQALKDNRGYYLVLAVRQRYDKAYLGSQSTVEVAKILKDLPASVPDVVEREFLNEALICFEHKAFRAAVVMTWNLAYSHLLEFILTHHLAAFNAKYPFVLPGKWAKAKAKPISAYDDFSVDLQESEVLEIAKSANAISTDVFKVLHSKLGRRNSAAHPSSVVIGQLQMDEFIHDLVTNVVLKLKI